MSLVCSTDTLREEAEHIACDGYVTTGERLEGAADEIDQLRADNAKLRELFLDVWLDALSFDDFWDYVHDDGEIYPEDELPHYQERMRELGTTFCDACWMSAGWSGTTASLALPPQDLTPTVLTVEERW